MPEKTEARFKDRGVWQCSSLESVVEREKCSRVDVVVMQMTINTTRLSGGGTRTRRACELADSIEHAREARSEGQITLVARSPWFLNTLIRDSIYLA